MKPQTLKGFRDFLPEAAIARQNVIAKLREVFELYGFDPLETPALEYAETLMGKYGAEADKLLYLFEDRGGRKVGLRYDQTVPLARVISQYPELPKPFKRYQIQPVWRAENPQKGRFREFLQCDIDTIGEAGISSDAEIIACVLKTMQSLGFKHAKMLINDRMLFGKLEPKYIVAIDKLTKIGIEAVQMELVAKGMEKNAAEALLASFADKKPSARLTTLFSLLTQQGYGMNQDFVFDSTLARGLDYYTSTIFELVSADYSTGSLGGGGRYDNLIGQFIGTETPAVGFSFGFDRLLEAMDQHQLVAKKTTMARVLVTVFGPDNLGLSTEIVSQLRTQRLAAEIYLDPSAKLEKQLKYADKKGIPYAIIIGPDEVERNLVTLKDLRKKEQKTLSLADALSMIHNSS